jgi:hypothetical protein
MLAPHNRAININGSNMRLYDTPDGQFPSVTTVVNFDPTGKGAARLAEWKVKWQEENPDLPEDYFAQRGTMCHEACEKVILGTPLKEIEVHEWAAPFFKQALPYIRGITKPVWIEQPLLKHHQEIPGVRVTNQAGEDIYQVWSKLGFAGRPDWVGTYQGHLTLLDLKTSSKPYSRNFTPATVGGWHKFMKCAEQLAAYKLALQETLDITVKKLVVFVVLENGAQQFTLSDRDVQKAESRFLDKLKQFQDHHQL